MIKKSANYNRIIHSGKVHLFPYVALRDHYAVDGYKNSYVLSIASITNGMQDNDDVCVFCSMMVHDPTSPNDNPQPMSKDFARGLFHRVNGDGGTVDLGHVEVFRAIASLLTFDGVEVMIPVLKETDGDLGFEAEWVPFKPDSVHQCILVLSNGFLADPLEHAIDFDNPDVNRVLQVESIIKDQEDENALIGPKERRDREKHEKEIRKMVQAEEENRRNRMREGLDSCLQDSYDMNSPSRSGKSSLQKQGIPSASLDNLSKSLGFSSKSRKRSSKINKNKGYFSVPESS